MLSLSNVVKSYDKPVLSSFSYQFPDRGLFRICGKSGCGKTTLLRLIAGLEKPDSGTVVWNGVPRISMVFQEARLLDHMTLLGNVLLVKNKTDLPYAEEILKHLGLWEDRAKHPPALSGGMKLRASIARAWYYDGDVFLMDEPTRELDEDNRKIIFSLLDRLSEQKLILCATHETEWKSGTQINLN